MNRTLPSRGFGGRKDQVDQEIPGTLLLDPEVLGDPYPLYQAAAGARPGVGDQPGPRSSRSARSSSWSRRAPGSTDFSSNMKCLLYRDDAGLPGRFTFGDAGGQALATADPPLHEIHRRAVFPELVTKRMEALDPEIRELADGLVTSALAERDDRVHERHWQRRADHDDQPAHRVSRQQPRRALALGRAHDQVGWVDTDARRARGFRGRW